MEQSTLLHQKTGRLGYTSYALEGIHKQRDTRELTHSFFSPNEGLQFALLQQDSHGCNMHLRNMALHRGPREMRENNSIARRCQKLAAVFRNSKVSLFFCCTIRNIQIMWISKNSYFYTDLYCSYDSLLILAKEDFASMNVKVSTTLLLST